MDKSKEEQDAYTWAQIEDEARLAPLLGWLDVAKPSTLNGVASLMGAHKLQAAQVANARQARTFLPRWRRDWGAAGCLIAQCQLNIFQTDHLMTVNTLDARISVSENANNHPSQDDALRCAIVRCAIAVLEQRA